MSLFWPDPSDLLVRFVQHEEGYWVYQGDCEGCEWEGVNRPSPEAAVEDAINHPHNLTERRLQGYDPDGPTCPDCGHLVSLHNTEIGRDGGCWWSPGPLGGTGCGCTRQRGMVNPNAL